MRQLILSLGLIIGLTSAAHAEKTPWMPTTKETLSFDVTRNGDKFGNHSVTFEPKGDELKVNSDIRLIVRFGPIVPFRYTHTSEETWKHGQLVGLTAQTRKDGDRLKVAATRDGDKIAVDGAEGDYTFPVDVIPSSHWNIGQLYQENMMSSETGKPLPVDVENLGLETITAGGKEIEATRYRLKSDIVVDLWYDADNRWVKCSFEARDQKIEYTLAS